MTVNRSAARAKPTADRPRQGRGDVRPRSCTASPRRWEHPTTCTRRSTSVGHQRTRRVVRLGTEPGRRRSPGSSGWSPERRCSLPSIVHSGDGCRRQCEDPLRQPGLVPRSSCRSTSRARRRRTTCSRSLRCGVRSFFIEAALPTAEEAALLGIGPGDSVPDRRPPHVHDGRGDHDRAVRPARRALHLQGEFAP